MEDYDKAVEQNKISEESNALLRYCFSLPLSSDINFFDLTLLFYVVLVSVYREEMKKLEEEVNWWRHQSAQVMTPFNSSSYTSGNISYPPQSLTNNPFSNQN
jgi:hypothetical protein